MFFIDFSTLLTGAFEDCNQGGNWSATHRLVINEDRERLHLTACYLAGMLRIALTRMTHETPDPNDRKHEQTFTIARLLWAMVTRFRVKTWDIEGRRGNVLSPDYPFGTTDMAEVTNLMLDKIESLSDHEFADWLMEQTNGPLPFPTVAKLRPVTVAT